MSVPELMTVEINVPADATRAVTEDLRARGGRVDETRKSDDTETIVGQIPSREITTYGPVLRRLTKGRGTFHTRSQNLRPPAGL